MAGDSRNGSSASWIRRMPVACNFATWSCGVAGCSDQLHTARRSVRDSFFMVVVSNLDLAAFLEQGTRTVQHFPVSQITRPECFAVLLHARERSAQRK